ncbi:hypothetical protein NIES2109_11360 [Nostoc sp. HK-01]|nr:hypothetical protein NIES2109_11360 [Nostoc sp. HK-01]
MKASAQLGICPRALNEVSANFGFWIADSVALANLRTCFGITEPILDFGLPIDQLPNLEITNLKFC